MTQVTLNIEDDKLKAFIAFIKTLNYVSVATGEEISQWQKDLVSDRKKTKKSDYLSIESLDDEIKLQE